MTNRKLIMKKAFEILGKVFTAVVIGGFLAVMFIEWAAGCGETYVDSKGIMHLNSCIILNHGE